MKRSDTIGEHRRVIGIGVDLADVDRVAAAVRRHGKRFAARVLHAHECAAVERAVDPDRALSEAFALKEAALKALGTGWAGGPTFADVERVGGSGRIELRLHGAASARALELGGDRIFASVSGDRRTVCALVILEGFGATPDRAVR